MNVRLISIAVAALLLTDADFARAEGIYGGVGVGAVQIEEFGSDFPLGRRIFAGLETSNTLAFEAVFLSSNFTEQNALSIDGLRVRFSGVAVYGTASTPAATRGRFMARLGAFAGRSEVISSTGLDDDSTGGFALGIGYALDLNERLALRADFDTFLQPEFESLSSLTVSLQLRFGD